MQIDNCFIQIVTQPPNNDESSEKRGSGIHRNIGIGKIEQCASIYKRIVFTISC